MLSSNVRDWVDVNKMVNNENLSRPHKHANTNVKENCTHNELGGIVL